MPLIKGKSPKAFSKNVSTEMDAGKPQKQALAIAYSVKRKSPKKKMAEGGEISAKTEKRPMPGMEYQDKHEAARNAAKKALVQDDWTDQPTMKQARKGMKTTPIKHPSMAESPIIKAKMRDEEDHLQTSAKVNNGPQIQPPKDDDEIGPDRQGRKVPDMQREHNNGRKPYAAGGMTVKEDSEEAYERADQMDHMDQDAPSEDEGSEHADMLDEEGADRHGDDVPDMEEEHSTHRMPYAGGGEIGDDEENMDHEMDMNPAHDKHSPVDDMDQPMDEEEEEHHASITAAIMAKRARMHAEIASGAHDEDEAAMMAEGGILSHGSEDVHEDADQADLSRNADEDANEEDQMSFDALRKENYSESAGLKKMGSPRDSNEHGDDEESDSENKRDMVSAIRSKMAKKRR